MSQLSNVPRMQHYVPPPVAIEHEEQPVEPTITDERLPFSVRIVRNEADLSKAVSVRAAAYGRHMPEFGEKLRVPEVTDSEPGVTVLLAESKLDATPLGTLRIQSNAYMPLKVEQSVTLPLWMRDRPLAEVSRLGVVSGTIGRLVKIILIKAAFQHCELDGVDWAIVAARAPLDRQYDQLMFEDLFPELGFIPMRHGNNIPHRVLGFEIQSGQARWEAANHPLLKYFCYTRHPDVDVHIEREDDWGGLFPAPSMARFTPPLGRRPV